MLAGLLSLADALHGQSIGRSSLPLWVRLQSAVDSKVSLPNSTVEAVVIQSHAGSGGRSIPMGSRVTGRVLPVPAKQRSNLLLRFESVNIAGTNLPLMAHVLEVDNAREQVDAEGKIIGLDTLRKKPGKVELVLLAAAYAHPAALALIATSKLALRAVERPEVHYPAGTDMALVVDMFPDVTPSAATEPPEQADPRGLADLFQALPSRTQAKHPPQPSDWINIAFVGGRQNLDRAFLDAGWQTAQQVSIRADVRVFLAVAEHHAYQQAPVSTLLLFGREPDLVFQKQTNTFAKRHHIRIWSTDKVWEGQPVWIAAATHDIGIDFSTQARTFTHRVESDIDLERSKVIRDLRFDGAIASLFYVTRPSLPAGSRNATGDSIRTDGRLAVVELTPR